MPANEKFATVCDLSTREKLGPSFRVRLMLLAPKTVDGIEERRSAVTCLPEILDPFLAVWAD